MCHTQPLSPTYDPRFTYFGMGDQVVLLSFTLRVWLIPSRLVNESIKSYQTHTNYVK